MRTIQMKALNNCINVKVVETSLLFASVLRHCCCLSCLAAQRVCSYFNTWVNSLLSCYAVVSCADPGKVEHSRRVLSGPHFTVGSTIQYVCNKGFILSGNSLLTCFNRGSSGPKWNQKLPRCLRMYHLSSFHTRTVSVNIPGNNLGGLYMWTQIPYFCLGFTFPAPLLSCLGSLKVAAESGRGWCKHTAGEKWH